jgi:hypothetical protein
MDGEGGEAYVCRCAIFAWVHSYADGLALSQRRQARLASGHSFVPFPQPSVEPVSLGSAAAGPFLSCALPFLQSATARERVQDRLPSDASYEPKDRSP